MNEDKMCVLVPAYNEEKVIAGTIKSLRNAGFNAKHIYVVDDRSVDSTASIAKKSGANVFTVPQNGGSKAIAQIAGLQHFELFTKYDWIIFLDADTKVDSQFKNVMFASVERYPNTALFVGSVESARNDHLFSASRAYEYTYGQEISKKGQDNFNAIFVAPGCSAMYRSTVLEKLNIDPETLAEDMDLTLQVHRLKGKVRFIPKAIVVTQDPSTLSDYVKQNTRWYRGFWQVALKHRIFSLGKKQPVDIYMIYAAISALIFNPILALAVGCFMFKMSALVLFFIGNVAIFLIIASLVACKTKRFEVLYKAPIYYWIQYVNFYAFYKSFFEVVIFQKKLLDWNKVKRYNFDSITTT